MGSFARSLNLRVTLDQTRHFRVRIDHTVDVLDSSDVTRHGTGDLKERNISESGREIDSPYVRLAAGVRHGDPFDTAEEFGHFSIDSVQRLSNLILTFENRSELSIVFAFELEERVK